jgi:amidase
MVSQASFLTYKQVNCLSEIFFETALEAAERLDAEYTATGIAGGPLHGLPVSLKDCFRVEATDSAIGYTAFLNQPTAQGEESEITNIMRQSGAILFCKTSVPLALMAGEVSSFRHNTRYYTSDLVIDI